MALAALVFKQVKFYSVGRQNRGLRSHANHPRLISHAL